MKLIILVFIASAFISLPAASANSGGAISADVVAKAERNDGSAIHYYLDHASRETVAATLLVFLQGSDCNSVKRDEFTQTYADAAWPGADVLLVEKAGITADLPYSLDSRRPDCPTYYISKDSPAQRVKDLQAVLDHAVSERSYENIILLGGSEGATVAAMFAAVSELPNAVVVINGGGRWFIDDVLHNIKSTTPMESLQSEMDGFREFAEHVLSSDPSDIEVSGHGYNWWRNVLAIDQEAVFRQIEVPVLVVQAGRDKAVSSEAVLNMVTKLKGSGKSNLELAFYPEMNHKLRVGDGGSMADQVFADINKWLNTKLSARTGKVDQKSATKLAGNWEEADE